MRCTNPTVFPTSNGPVACGQCMSCRIGKLQKWRSRMLLELSYYGGVASFVTLTYAPEHLPMKDYFPGGELVKSDLQKFIKRVRKNLGGREIKYYAVGEYGDKSQRAHYHVVFFNVDPIADEEVIRKSWKFGIVHIGKDAKEGALGYTLGYTIKKMTSEKDFPDNRQPEFPLMSQGLGRRALPALAERLRKHKLFPVRSSSQWQLFLSKKYGLSPMDHGWKKWNGLFYMHGKACLLDSYMMTNLGKLLLPFVYEAVEINDNALYDDRDEFLQTMKEWKVRKDRLTHDAYLSKIRFERSEEYEEAIKKAKKIHYQVQKRKTF